MMKLNLKNILGLVFVLFFHMTQTVFAGNANLPHVFSSGERVYANQINDNFNELSKAVNSKPEIMASVGYSKTPTVRNVTISNVLVNGGMITAPVKSGSTITISLDYAISDPGCPNCIDQIQVGFSHLSPVSCVYDGIPSVKGASGSKSFKITAPTKPGTYYIGVDRSQQRYCPKDWWNGAPTAPNRWIAAIAVIK